MKGLFCRMREVEIYLLREAWLAVRVCASGGDGADLVCGYLEHRDVRMSSLMLPRLCSQMPLPQPQRHSKGMLHLQSHPNLCLAASNRDIIWCGNNSSSKRHVVWHVASLERRMFSHMRILAWRVITHHVGVDDGGAKDGLPKLPDAAVGL